MVEHGENDEKSLKFKRIGDNSSKVAVAVKDNREGHKTPIITAAARGVLAEKIMQIAFENDIKVREDADLAEILAQMELDNPVPTEALMAVAEILSYVYRANGEPDPFNAILNPAEGAEDI